MSLLADDKGISVSCNVEEDVQVEGDSARIKQVVVNLLDNAIKYTPPGGSIQLNIRRQDQKAIMEVVDTGIGIPAAALPRVFERFFRVDAARSREGERRRAWAGDREIHLQRPWRACRSGKLGESRQPFSR